MALPFERAVLKTPKPMSLEKVAQAVRASWTSTTSYDPTGWSETNPAWGQCAVTALIVQDFFGGTLWRGHAFGHEHYWNQLAERKVDLTIEQFHHSSQPSSSPADAPSEVSREYVLSFPSTRERYHALRDAVCRALSLDGTL